MENKQDFSLRIQQKNLNFPTSEQLNLTSLYHQLMLYLDKNLSKPTVNFCVSDLDVLAKQELNPGMNPLVLIAYIFPRL
jgi:hypothetical protein